MQVLLDEKTATAAESAAKCAVSTSEATKEAASLAGINGGIASDEGKPVLAQIHQGAVGALSDNIEWLSNARGINGSGNFAADATRNRRGRLHENVRRLHRHSHQRRDGLVVPKWLG